MMNFRFRPDLASPDEPSMSIQPPPSIAPPDAPALHFGLSTLRPTPSRPATNLRLAPAIMSSGLSGSCGLRLASSAASPVTPAINSRFPTGSSVKETLLPAKLWMQVQITLNPVDFTSRGAAFAAMRFPCTLADAFTLQLREILENMPSGSRAIARNRGAWFPPALGARPGRSVHAPTRDCAKLAA